MFIMSFLLFSTHVLTSFAQEALQPGTYYIQNKKAGGFLTSGENYGTRGVLRPHGVDVTVTVSDGAYSILTRLNGSTKYLNPSDGYMDGSGTWTITPLDDGTYALYSDVKSFYYGINPEKSDHTPRIDYYTDTESDYTHWKFWTKEELEATLENATADNPVDATFYITSPDFPIADRRVSTDLCWGSDITGTAGNTSSSTYCYNSGNVEIFNKAGVSATQTLTGIPNGVYSLSVQGFYRYGSVSTGSVVAFQNHTEEPLALLFAGKNSVAIKSLYSEAKSTQDSGYDRSTDVGYVPNGQKQAAFVFSDPTAYVNTLTNIIVTDNTLTLGVRKENKAISNDWICFDNFTLLYYGIDLSAIKEQALATLSEYEALNTAGSTEFSTLIEEQRAIINAATSDDAIAEAVNKVKEAYVYLKTYATPTDEALDLTDMLVNPNLKQGLNGWTTSGTWANNSETSTAVTEAYAGWSSVDNPNFSMSQQVALSPGKYRLTAEAFYRWGIGYDSDIKTDGVERSMAYLFAGDNQTTIKRLGSEDIPALRPYNYANTLEEGAAALNAGIYKNELIFEVTEKSIVQVGYKGTHTEAKSWFVAGPMKLEKISDSVLAAEDAASLEAAKNEYQSLKATFNNIATQSDLATFSTSTADAAFEAATNIEEVEGACNLLADALAAYMEECNIQFDLTELLVNPGFETGTLEGWDVYSIGDISARNDLVVSNCEGNYLLNSWTTSSSEAINHFVLQTVKHMPKGSYQLTAVVSSSQLTSNLRVVANYLEQKAVISGSSDGHKTLLAFQIDESQDMRLGVASNRYFRADVFHLYYGSVMYAKREDCLARIEALEEIAKQSTDRTDYDKAVEEALEALESATTVEEADQAVQDVVNAAKTLIATKPATKGVYDITPLIINPDIAGVDGWTASDVPTNSNGIAEIFNNTGDFSIMQTIENMPAGNYTFAVQGFHRNGDYTSLRTQYVNRGISSVAANIKLGDNTKPIMNIFDNTRYKVLSPSGDYKPMPDGSAFPNGMDTANETFSQGLYWNTISTTTEATGNLEFGIQLSGGAANNWLTFDNSHLFYGGTYELSADTLTTLAAPIVANLTSTRTLKTGQLNAVILPYSASLSDFDAVFELGRIEGSNATLVPATSMKAGKPYFVRVAEDKLLSAENVLIENVVPDSIPAMWDGTFQTGFFKPTEIIEGFILNDDGSGFIKANATTEPCTPVFYLPLSYGDVDALGITVIESLADLTFTPQIENYKAHEFIKNNTYTKESESVIKSYNVMPPARLDMPNAVTIPIPAQATVPSAQKFTVSTTSDFSEDVNTKTMPAGATVYRSFNYIPGVTYYYKVEADDNIIANGQFTPDGHLRMIFLNSGSNIRDLGGWTTENGTQVKYGKIFRGAELHAGKQTTVTSTDLLELRRLGLRTEIDLREDVDFSDGLVEKSALGTTAGYYYFNQSMWDSDALKEYKMQYRNSFNLIAKNLEQEQGVYFHCIWGADRTGAMAFLIEGLLGVEKSDMYKDYELTTFSKAGSRVKSNLEDKFNYIDTFAGETQQERFYNYLHEYVGIPADTLNTIIRLMTDLPEIELDETMAYVPEKVSLANVNFKRTINNGLNTVVLPFELNTAQVEEYFGEGTTIYTLGGEREREGNEGVFTLLFEELDHIPAGVPVIIDATCDEWSEMTFPAMSIDGNDFQTVETEHFSFVSVQEPTTVPEGAFFLKKGTSEIKRSLGSTPIKAYRAYIAINDDSDVKGINISLDGSHAVGISDVAIDANESRIYDFSGRRIDNDNHSRLIITKGKKFIKK